MNPARSWLSQCLLIGGLALAVPAALAQPAPGQAQTADVQFPTGSRLGLKPPQGLTPSTTFPGFEDEPNSVYVRLIALPDKAFADIEKTMTRDGLKKQGLIVEKIETPAFRGGKSVLVVAQQDTSAGRVRKWLMVAPVDDVTALISFEMPDKAKSNYPDASIRAALMSLTTRASVPADEQLSLLPFKLTELAGLRLVGVIPGRAVQLTDGPKDLSETVDQAHLVIGVVPGGPPQGGDRSSFARSALGGLPNLTDFRLTSSEPMRIGGQQGHEIRAEGKDAKTGANVEIVQWLRFGTGAYIRYLGFGPQESWTQTFAKFRAVRDGLEPR